MGSTERLTLLSRISALPSFRNYNYLLLILTGLAALFFLIETGRSLPVRGENVYPESAGVLAAQRWARGSPLYEDYRQAPYLMTAFPPVWYATLVLAAQAGLSNLDSLTLFGRILSLASLVAIALLAFLWHMRLGLPSRLALFSPSLYLSFPILIPWAVTARPDFPGLFFSFLAVYWVGLRSNTRWVGLGGLAAGVAFLIRHNAVAAPIALVLWLLWLRRWKHAVIFCAVWATVVGFVLIPFQFSSGGLLLLNLSGAKFGDFAATYVRDVLIRLLGWEGQSFAIALCAFGTLGLVESLKRKDAHGFLLTTYLIISTSLALLGSAAAGGGVNHYLEPALCMALLAPTALAGLEIEWRTRSSLAAFAFILTFAWLLPSLDIQRWNAMHRTPENLRTAVNLVSNRKVFTDVPYLAARSATPHSVDLASLINTERVGGWAAWSSQMLAQDLQKKRYALVVLSRPVEIAYLPDGRYPRAPRIDAALKNAITSNYQLCLEVDSSYVYAPILSGADFARSCQSLAQSSTTGAITNARRLE